MNIFRFDALLKTLDLGVKRDSDPNDPDLMFHRVGLRVGAEISEGNYERAMIFCGTGMGIHIAASKCPHVHAGLVESLPAATRAITGKGVNVFAMGAFYVAPQTACDIADAYLGNELGSGWEWWHNFMVKRILPFIDFEKACDANLNTVSTRLKRLFPNHHPHELRYTFITRCKECGVNPEVVMLWAGHSEDKDVLSSRVNRGYTDFSEGFILQEAEKVNYGLIT